MIAVPECLSKKGVPVRTSAIVAVSFLFLSGDPAPTSNQASGRDGQEKAPKSRTASIPPEMYQYAVSMHEEGRESLDFLMAVPELIQQSLQKRKVLIYDQN